MPVGDISGWTFQEAAPQAAQPAQNQLPQADITKHDPQTYASLTTNQAIQNLHDQGLMPEVGTGQDIYKQALQDANQYHSRLAEQQEAANVELQKRQAAVSSGVLGQEKATEAAVELKKTEALQQWEQTGKIDRPSDQDESRVNGFVNGYNTADTLQKYHTQMASTTPGAGGWLRSNVLGFVMQPNITSQESKDFNAYLESGIVPLGRGVFGDAAAAATKDTIQQNMRDMLPNTSDNPLSAGHKTFMLKDRIMQNLITDRSTAIANNKNPAIWDAAIGRLSGDYNSQATRQFAPGFMNQNPLVTQGTSDQTNAYINNLNAGANAGVNAPATTPTGYVSGIGTATGGPSPATGTTQSQPPGSASAQAQQVQQGQQFLQSGQIPTIESILP